MTDRNDSLSPVLWLWIPLLGFLFQVVGEFFLYSEHINWVVSENGPYEFLQFFIMVAAFILGALILWRMDKSNPWLVAWIAIATLGSLYVAGEEISWSQQIFKFGTPEYWSYVNDQQETNLHNTTSWLDQKPRLILTIGVYIGGIIIPLLMKYKPALLPQKFTAIYPTREFMVTSVICLTIKIVDKIAEGFDFTILARNAENEEQFLFYFVLLYLLMMKKRLIPAK